MANLKITQIHVFAWFSDLLLPKVDNWSRKQICNENVHISILIFLWRVSVNMKWMTDQVSQKRIEEVSMKWIDRQIAKKREIPLKLIIFYKIFFSGTTMCYYIWSISVAFPCFFCTFLSICFRGTPSFRFCGTWSVHPFHRHYLYWPSSHITPFSRLLLLLTLPLIQPSVSKTFGEQFDFFVKLCAKPLSLIFLALFYIFTNHVSP